MAFYAGLHDSSSLVDNVAAALAKFFNLLIEVGPRVGADSTKKEASNMQSVGQRQSCMQNTSLCTHFVYALRTVFFCRHCFEGRQTDGALHLSI